MFIGRLNVMPDASLTQDVNDFAHRERIAAAPGEHDLLFALPLIERMPAQFFGHKLNAAHAAHRVTIRIFGVADRTIFHLDSSPSLLVLQTVSTASATAFPPPRQSAAIPRF